MTSRLNLKEYVKPTLILLALLFLYATVLVKLVADWWSDDNYSHGLLIPFVIGYIIWLRFDDLRSTYRRPTVWFGLATIFVSFMMLLAGTLAAELFMQRISLVVMLAGVVTYFFGTRILRALTVPFLLILFAIPIPQIVFNKVAFPLQLLASRIAAWAIGILNIASVRRGNVIEIAPVTGGPAIFLEVVEACSGIRSLMTLVTLALILGYLTSKRHTTSVNGSLNDFDKLRIGILMLSAVPIALLTNAARVTATAVSAYYYGPGAAEGIVHESTGALVFIGGLGMLVALNTVLKHFDRNAREHEPQANPTSLHNLYSKVTSAQTVALFIAILVGGILINWFENRGEIEVTRRPLSEMSNEIGSWQHRGPDLRFDAATEKVLRADDYLMRYYFSPGNAWINFYVGFYSSQRTGASYHSPLNCLPGSGWQLQEAGTVEVSNNNGESFTANKYIAQRNEERQILVYWYEGRGRKNASEYYDKIYTSLDGVMKRRTDGAFVRIMTPVGDDEKKAMENVLDFASKVTGELEPFVPR